MLDDAMTAHLHGGCALIVGTVAADGMPHASRAWGCTVTSVDHETRTAVLRLVLPADDTRLVGNLTATGRIAITSADVGTLRSLQLKGRVQHVEPAGTGDLAKVAQYTGDFFDDIVRNDGDPRVVLDTWPPGSYLCCTVIVDELFDQTPGPTAGRAVRSGASSPGGS